MSTQFVARTLKAKFEFLLDSDINQNATHNQGERCDNCLLSIANNQLLFNHCNILVTYFICV